MTCALVEHFSSVHCECYQRVERLQAELAQAWAEVKCFVCTDWMKQADQLRADLAQARQDRDDADRDVETLQAILKRQDAELAQARSTQENLLTGMETYLMEIRQLRVQNQALRMVVEDEFAGHEAYVDNVPCDAGNFDGESSRDCEHCQHARRLEVLRAALDGQAQPREE